MIELGRHIEILLLSNDCVIVPELGGFMAHHVPASYDEDDNLFLPPLRTLGFNPQLKLNDSLLAQSYIEAYDISYPEAIRRIEEEVNELKQHLGNQGSYELEDIGILYLNDDGGYVFEPCEAGILTPELYGLSSFEMKALPDTLAKNVKDNDKHIESQNVPEEAIPQKWSVEKDEPEDDEANTIKIKVAWIRNAVAFAAAVIGFLFITTPVSNSESSTVVASSFCPPVLMEHIPSQPSSDIEFKESKETSENKVSAAETTPNSVKKEVPDEKPSEEVIAKGYCIVMASHVAKKNAEAFVNELHEKGFSDAYIYIHNKIVRVVYGNYESEAEAYSVLNGVRGEKYFEQSWVYKKK